MENPGQSVDVTNDGRNLKIFCRSLLYPCWVPRSSLVGSSFKPQNLVMASRYQCICPVLAVSIFVPQSKYGSYKDIQVAQHANLLLASFFSFQFAMVPSAKTSFLHSMWLPKMHRTVLTVQTLRHPAPPPLTTLFGNRHNGGIWMHHNRTGNTNLWLFLGHSKWPMTN